MWAEAEAHCHDNLGGNLARIPDVETHELIKSYINSSGAGEAVTSGFWIGFNDIRNEGVFEWSNGGAVCSNTEYLPWARNEPNNNTKRSDEGQDCVQLW